MRTSPLGSLLPLHAHRRPPRIRLAKMGNTLGCFRVSTKEKLRKPTRESVPGRKLVPPCPTIEQTVEKQVADRAGGGESVLGGGNEQLCFNCPKENVSLNSNVWTYEQLLLFGEDLSTLDVDEFKATLKEDHEDEESLDSYLQQQVVEVEDLQVLKEVSLVIANSISSTEEKFTLHDRRQYLAHVTLNSVENTSQWKVLEAKETHSMHPNKENIIIEGVSAIPISPETNISFEKSQNSCNSISTLHFSSEQKEPSVEVSLSSLTPRGTTPIKGIPNRTSKYSEDKIVTWRSTPFNVRLERALNNGSAIA